MRLLLDTCTFLWLITDATELSPLAKEVCRDRGNEVFLSTVSTWEIAVKHALGRLPLPAAAERFIPEMRRSHEVASLPLDEESTLHLPRLPALTRDPFDRMLVCQAMVGGLQLVTPDEAVRQYPVRTLW